MFRTIWESSYPGSLKISGPRRRPHRSGGSQRTRRYRRRDYGSPQSGAGGDRGIVGGAGAGERGRDVARERWPLSSDRADTAATPSTNAGRAHYANRGAHASESGADDLRGCALDRPDESGSARSGGGPDSEHTRAEEQSWSKRTPPPVKFASQSPEQKPQDWSGVYVGVQGGAAFSRGHRE